MQPEGTRYGRTHKEWRELIDAGRQFVVEQARLGRMTTYTELNTVLRQRTSVRTFDFDLDSERAAMGELLGEIVQLERPNFEGHMISAIVIYLNENDAGGGFYALAEQRARPALRVDPRTAGRLLGGRSAGGSQAVSALPDAVTT